MHLYLMCNKRTYFGMAFEYEGIFIVTCLLWHARNGFLGSVSPQAQPHYFALQIIEDQFQPKFWSGNYSDFVLKLLR